VKVIPVSERSRKDSVTDDGFGFAARCAESLRLSESESVSIYRGSASSVVGGIASSVQYYGAFPERPSLSAHQAAELRGLYKRLVPTGLTATVALICLLFLIANCQKQAVTPVALAPEDMCSYCKMAISEKQYAAELVDSDGQAFKFDDIGCMANFIRTKKNTAKPVAYFVMDFNERQWIKAEDASYVRSSELRTPMNGGLIAFKTEAKAQEAATKFHGKLLRFKEILA